MMQKLPPDPFAASEHEISPAAWARIVRRLPPQLKQLVRIVGMRQAFTLVSRYGGTSLAIPSKVRQGHEQHAVYSMLGAEAFASLVEAYGGVVLQLPKYDSVSAQIRHEYVLALLANGATRREAALATGYTMRHIFNIQAEAEMGAHPGQGDLFAGWTDPSLEAEADVAVPTAHRPFPGREG